MDWDLHYRGLRQPQALEFRESTMAGEPGGQISRDLKERPSTHPPASAADNRWPRLLGQSLLELCLTLLGGAACGVCVGFFFVLSLGFPGSEILGYVSGLFFLAGLKFGFCIWLVQMAGRAGQRFLWR